LCNKEKKNRQVHIMDVLILYRDPMTEQVPEGYAKVWEVLEEQEDHFVLVVSFLGDPRERKVTRTYRKWTTET